MTALLRSQRNLMSHQAVTIHLLGRVLKVSCPAGQESALHLAAEELNTRLEDLSKRSKINNLEQLLIFTSLNLCNEVHQKDEQKQDDLSLRLQFMSQNLDKALQNYSERR
jgi:cell division protein ZapA